MEGVECVECGVSTYVEGVGEEGFVVVKVCFHALADNHFDNT